MKKKKRCFLIVGFMVLCACIICGRNFYQQQKLEVSTDDAAIDGKVVVLKPKIQGYVKAIYVEDNALVKAGDLVMEIDPTDYLLKVEAAKAKLSTAKAALRAGENDVSREQTSAPAKAAAAQKKIDAAKATWDKAASDRSRMEYLEQNGACSKEEYEHIVSAENVAKADLDAAAADAQTVNTASDTIEMFQNTANKLEADVQQAEVEVEQAQQDLQNTKIIALADGRITKRSIEVGSYVSSGTQLCSIVAVSELWVTANFKESQLAGICPGDKVDIKVDAFPNKHLSGVVDSIQAGTGSYFSLFPSENATGNFVKTSQRVPVKILLSEISSEDRKLLGPGMSVEPTIYLKNVQMP